MKRIIQPGDRVKVYATINGTIAETSGEVTRMRPDGMLYVNLRGRRGEIVAHPKQCRRLIPRKKRREIWLELKTFKETLAGHATRLHWSTIQLNGYARFVEAKEKK